MSTPRAAPLVRYERIGSVARLTIDHPPVNVLSAKTLDALIDALHRAEDDVEARAVVLDSAAERAFAAGADIREMAPLDPEGARLHAHRGQGATVAIEDLPLPVVAAVHGSCLGGGTEIALACDFIIASEDAVFGQPEINLGVMPGWGGTVRLPGRIGPARARRWILTGDSVRAGDAWDMGLVDRVVPRSELSSAAMELARSLAAKSPTALAAAKYALNHTIHPERRANLDYERELWERLFGTADQKAGMQAFLRKETWTSLGRTDWTRSSAGFPWARPPASPRAKRKNREK